MKKRCEFIKKALDDLKQSMAQGSEVIGYMHWSFCDNFEWQKEFSMQFGFVKVIVKITLLDIKSQV